MHSVLYRGPFWLQVRRKKIVVTVELEMACVLQSMFLMTRRSVVRRWITRRDWMLESIASDV
jgi:hypothetical protein